MDFKLVNLAFKKTFKEGLFHILLFIFGIVLGTANTIHDFNSLLHVLYLAVQGGIICIMAIIMVVYLNLKCK